MKNLNAHETIWVRRTSGKEVALDYISANILSSLNDVSEELGGNSYIHIDAIVSEAKEVFGDSDGIDTAVSDTIDYIGALGIVVTKENSRGRHVGMTSYGQSVFKKFKKYLDTIAPIAHCCLRSNNTLVNSFSWNMKVGK